eukprot:TRINITY_DN101868_c0_g1_i1.p1 TRINITY_DN101868_c0_g1~~TRINITY_DN101868_c0_g1_i1.p1  ORF type:complete len:977 (+),score=196.83 TRINITY_DN101868_c0_g1_i1:54-2984(+)
MPSLLRKNRWLDADVGVVNGGPFTRVLRLAPEDRFAPAARSRDDGGLWQSFCEMGWQEVEKGLGSELEKAFAARQEEAQIDIGGRQYKADLRSDPYQIDGFLGQQPRRPLRRWTGTSSDGTNGSAGRGPVEQLPDELCRLLYGDAAKPAHATEHGEKAAAAYAVGKDHFDKGEYARALPYFQKVAAMSLDNRDAKEMANVCKRCIAQSKDLLQDEQTATIGVDLPIIDTKVDQCHYADALGNPNRWVLDGDGLLQWTDSGQEAPRFSQVSFVMEGPNGKNYLLTDSEWFSPLRHQDVPKVLASLRHICQRAGVKHNIEDRMYMRAPEPEHRVVYAARGLPSSKLRRLRIFVFRNFEWHPVSRGEEDQIKRGLLGGQACVKMDSGPLKWAVDTRDWQGWWQVDRYGNRRRLVCCPLLGCTSNDKVSETAYQEQIREGFTDERLLIPASRTPTLSAWECKQGIISALEDEFRELSASRQGVMTKTGDFGPGLPRGGLFDKWSFALKNAPEDAFEQKLLAKRANARSTAASFAVQKVADGRKADNAWESLMVTARTRSSPIAPAAPADVHLVRLAEEELYWRTDVDGDKILTSAEWMHYRLLEMQAPCQFALLEVQALMRERMADGETGLLRAALNTFVDALDDEWSSAEARLTAATMRRLAQKWLVMWAGKLRSTAATPLQAKALAKMERLVYPPCKHTHAQAEDYSSYYDFVNAILGRSEVKIRLYMYAQTHKTALALDKDSWTASMVEWTDRETWQNTLVVHGKEYSYFAGRIMVNTPGKGPFGAPDKIIELPCRTMRSPREIWHYLHREGRFYFPADAYDWQEKHSTHFADALYTFLTGDHVPAEHWPSQPSIDELVIPSMVTRHLVMPHIGGLLTECYTRLIDNFLAVDSAQEAADCRVFSPQTSEDEWQQLAVDSLVQYEYEPGWFAVARIVKKAEQQCDLHWCDLHSGQIRLEEDVPKTFVHALQRLSAATP